MRSVNNYSLYSNWSSPAILNLSDISVVHVVITLPAPPSPQKQFPVYAYPVIAVAILLLLAVLIVMTYLCVSNVRKHCCVDIVRMKMGNK